LSAGTASSRLIILNCQLRINKYGGLRQNWVLGNHQVLFRFIRRQYFDAPFRCTMYFYSEIITLYVDYHLIRNSTDESRISMSLLKRFRAVQQLHTCARCVRHPRGRWSVARCLDRSVETSDNRNRTGRTRIAPRRWLDSRAICPPSARQILGAFVRRLDDYYWWTQNRLQDVFNGRVAYRARSTVLIKYQLRSQTIRGVREREFFFHPSILLG